MYKLVYWIKHFNVFSQNLLWSEIFHVYSVHCTVTMLGAQPLKVPKHELEILCPTFFFTWDRGTVFIILKSSVFYSYLPRHAVP